MDLFSYMMLIGLTALSVVGASLAALVMQWKPERREGAKVLLRLCIAQILTLLFVAVATNLVPGYKPADDQLGMGPAGLFGLGLFVYSFLAILAAFGFIVLVIRLVVDYLVGLRGRHRANA